MSPLKRRQENRGLPARWTWKNGSVYYIVPPACKAQWDGKTWFRLGGTLQEAYRTWADRGVAPEKPTTIGELLDRYLLDTVPGKAPKTQTENKRHLATLRAVFGAMALEDLEPQHVYQYAAKRGKATAAKREIEVLSHAFTKAVEWGLIAAHPFKGEVRISGAAPRTRYVEDWELEEALSLPPTRKVGSVRMVQAYLRLKLLTGLRQRDLLLLTVSDCREDGIHVTPSKTKASTGKRVIYEWSPELRAAVESAKDARPALSPYLFCQLDGKCFVRSDGTAGNWNNIWQHFMTRVLKETAVSERFTEHDLRAKVGSDAESLERARQLLAHSDARMTARVYRRKPERIKPAGAA
ncbi:tyrosine-type recombinase/integrase [Rhodocyclus purpureus]|uniref:tyrosine-type recombinase/integrase n=1 Tax=Rhodocyclus purpureus TaxID=1067 RepID=UPI0019130C84|nr:tyrosine-type recombinase/integrase [Rhodocyclus purpureus]MBK5915118.1 integrase [Rhodocyclus purpureus]